MQSVLKVSMILFLVVYEITPHKIMSTKEFSRERLLEWLSLWIEDGAQLNEYADDSDRQIYNQIKEIIIQHYGGRDAEKSAKQKKYCIMCGNQLDPKIHIVSLGKTSKEVAKKQREILTSVIKYL